MKLTGRVAKKLRILSADMLPAYLAQLLDGLAEQYEQLTDSPLSADTFSFYVSVSAVFFSKIEG